MESWGEKPGRFILRSLGSKAIIYREPERSSLKCLGSWGALLEFDFPIRLLFIHINITVPFNSFSQKHAGGGGGGGARFRIFGEGGGGVANYSLAVN